MREMAAILACGPEAVVSHRSAAGLWKLLPSPGGSAPVDITEPGARRRVKGIRARRGPALEPDEIAEVHGIPVTAPARTLLDLAGIVRDRELEQALAQADRSGLSDRATLGSLLQRRPGHRGVRRIRDLLDAPTGPALTRSEAEERFLALVKKARLPTPDTNVVVGTYEVDFLWRPQRLVIEVDGYAFHSSRSRFESDRERDADLAARGLQVIRVTWDQVVNAREATLARVAQALAAR